MRYLVTGGAGFVGSHVVDLLLREGHRVDVIDNFATGDRSNLVRRTGLRLIEANIVSAPLPKTRYDGVFHLASPASPIAYRRMGIATLLVNATGTKRLLDLAERSDGVFLLASTSEVYGDPLEHPQAEDYWGNVSSTGPRCAYDEGKRFAEALTATYVRERSVDARIVRIFNSYGPRMRADDGRMPAAFIVAALSGDPLRVEGDGRQTRSLCYVEDTALGIWRAFERGSSGTVYNIGRPEEISVLDFARQVIIAAGSGSAIVHVDGRPEEIHRRCPDIGRAARDLRWTPRVDLATGLKRTVRWYRNHLS